MNNNLKRLIIDLISFLTIGIFTQVFIRFSYLKRAAQEYLGDDFNSDAYNNFSHNPIIGGFRGFFNFFEGDWGNSILRDRPVLQIVIPAAEHGFVLVRYLLIGIIFGIILPYTIIKMDKKRVTQIFNSYIPITIISVIYLVRFLDDPSPLVYSGFRDRIFDETHPGGQLIIQITNFLIIGMMTKKSLQLYYDFRNTGERSNTFELILRGLKSQLSYIFMIWMGLSNFLNLPTIPRYWISSAITYDYPLFVALFMFYLAIYYTIVILIDLILVIVSNQSSGSFPIRPAETVSQPVWKKSIIFGFGFFVILITLAGLFAFPEYMSKSSQLSIINSSDPADLGNISHPLGTNSEGFDNLVLLSVYFLIISLIVSFQVVLFLIVKKYLNQYLSEESVLSKLLFDYTKSLPSFLILGIIFILLINPASNIFVTTLLLFFITFPLSLKQIIPIINNSSTSITEELLNLTAMCYSITFLNLLYAGMFNYSKSYLYMNIITSLGSPNQYEFFFWFTLVIILSLLFISSTSMNFRNQDDKELYPNHEKTGIN